MITKQLTRITVLLMVLLSAAVIFGQEEDMPKEKHGRMGRMNLTEQQTDQIHTLKTEAEAEMLPLETKLKTKQAELKELMVAEKPSQRAINSKIDEIGNLQTTIQKKRIGHRLEVRSLLTDEQKVWFDRMDGAKRGRRGFRDRHFSRRHGARGDRGRMHRGIRRRRVHPVEEDVDEVKE